MGIASAHIGDELDLLQDVLIGRVMGSSGSITEGFDGVIEMVFSAISVLMVGLTPTAARETPYLSMSYQHINVADK